MRGFDSAAYRGHTIPAPFEPDLALLGAAVLNSVCATLNAGHKTPGETLDYTTAVDAGQPDDSAAAMIVRDLIAWTSRRDDMAPGARDRLTQFVVCSGWYSDAVDRVGAMSRNRAA